MNIEQFSDRTANELFGALMPYLGIVFVGVIIFIPENTASYAGIAFGIGMVLLATILKHRENQQRNSG